MDKREQHVHERGRDDYDFQICVGHSTPSEKATALEPDGVFGLAKFCTLGLATTHQVSRASHR
jgi:hypothetical protein